MGFGSTLSFSPIRRKRIFGKKLFPSPVRFHATGEAVALAVLLFLILPPRPAFAAPNASAPVNLTAQSLVNDDAAQTVTAQGDVEMVQDGRILRASEVVYDLKNDRVTARGEVALSEPGGDVYFFDEIALTGDLREGFVKGLTSLLADGSRFTANEGTREGGRKTVMKEASYTPCEPCKADPDKPPVWAIRADEVTHDSVEKRISYRDATFDILGVPIAWLPYFSHPDGSVKRKSGFLTPSFGWNSDLGGIARTRYYWSIAPDKDLTAGAMLMTRENPLLFGEYRQRWDDASLEISGGATRSGRTDRTDGRDVEIKDEARGHLFADGLWNIDEKWRAGAGLELASDDQYLRQYDFSEKDVLENEIYAERFSGRDYASARLLGFQDVRVREERTDQPDVLPEIVTSFYGEPNALLGGRWALEASALGLERPGGGQDMTRLSAAAGWQRRFVANVGIVSTVNASVRADGYESRDLDSAQGIPGRSDSATRGRAVPTLHAASSLPLARPLGEAQMTLEPVAALTLVPGRDLNKSIPNEDSRDAQIDALNLFDADRNPGMDRVEEESRATYGLRAGLQGQGGEKIEGFFGQSHRFSDESSSFPPGSGLDSQRSDYVGQVSALAENYDIDYRFRLGGEDFSSQGHEAGANVDFGRIDLGGRYFYSRPFEGADFATSREQIEANAGIDLTRSWRAQASALYDVGEEDPGLRRATFGLGYTGQCFTVSTTAHRRVTRDSSGESGTEIMLRIGLKNLGEFETNGIGIGGDTETEESEKVPDSAE